MKTVGETEEGMVVRINRIGALINLHIGEKVWGLDWEEAQAIGAALMMAGANGHAEDMNSRRHEP